MSCLSQTNLCFLCSVTFFSWSTLKCNAQVLCSKWVKKIDDEQFMNDLKKQGIKNPLGAMELVLN
jgi:hypothetical protein